MEEPASFSERIINDKSIEPITRAEELAYELRIDEVMTKQVTTLTPAMKMSEVPRSR